MKLLLVDDEEYAREGLVARIDWDSLGITEIMTARNGIDGLKRAGTLNRTSSLPMSGCRRWTGFRWLFVSVSCIRNAVFCL